MITSEAEVSANGCLKKDIKTSAQRFIARYYEDLKGGDKSKIKQYHLERPDEESIKALTHAGRIVSHKPLDEEDLEWMVGSGKFLAEILDKIEFLEVTIISKKPLIIEVDVIERYKPEAHYGPNDEVLFLLKDLGGCKWKIVDESAPGLP